MLSIASAVLAIMALMRTLKTKKDYDREDGNDNYGKMSLVFAIPLLALISMLIFILTQDMQNMNLNGLSVADGWTAVHGTLFTGELLCYTFAYKKTKTPPFANL